MLCYKNLIKYDILLRGFSICTDTNTVADNDILSPVNEVNV